MKNPTIKVIKSWLNKIKYSDFKKFLNQKIIFFVAPLILILIIVIYFLRPVFFNYSDKYILLQDNIYNSFKLKTNFEDKVSYKVFPSPRIVISNLTFNFDKDKINVNEIAILISPLKLQNIDSFEFKKILILNQNIKVYPSNLDKLFKFFSQKKNEKVILKNSQITFIDDQKNQLSFNNLNLKDSFDGKKHQIKGDVKFSGNKIYLEFLNITNEEKLLKINIPNLKQSLDINFTPKTTLDNYSGVLKLKLLETILLLNFNGKNKFDIKQSYLRNKFINSKIDGKINFKDQFSFDLNFDINKVNLRKLFFYYPIFQSGKISKKINGNIKIFIKNVDSLFGKFKDTKMVVNLENGDIKIKNLSTKLRDDSDIRSNIFFLFNSKKPRIEFNTYFSSEDTVKFMRKFGVYDFKEKKTFVFIEGSLDIKNKKINLTKISNRNNNQIFSRNDMKRLENSFNENILNEGILGLFDFFKVKKFFKEIN